MIRNLRYNLQIKSFISIFRRGSERAQERLCNGQKVKIRAFQIKTRPICRPLKRKANRLKRKKKREIEYSKMIKLQNTVVNKKEITLKAQSFAVLLK